MEKMIQTLRTFIAANKGKLIEVGITILGAGLGIIAVAVANSQDNGDSPQGDEPVDFIT